MTTSERIAPILTRTYGDNGLTRALVIYLADKIDGWRGHDREAMIVRTCWDWFPGGSTAEHVARLIEMELSHD